MSWDCCGLDCSRAFRRWRLQWRLRRRRRSRRRLRARLRSRPGTVSMEVAIPTGLPAAAALVVPLRIPARELVVTRIVIVPVRPEVVEHDLVHHVRIASQSDLNRDFSSEPFRHDEIHSVVVYEEA